MTASRARLSLSDRPSARDPEDDFLAAFEAFAQAVRRARGASSQTGEDVLTLSQYSLLESLGDGGPARVSELAAQAGVTPSTATRILDGLERRGIVSRDRLATDRRAVAVSLTAEGRTLLAGFDGWMQGRRRAFYAGLPGVERELAPDLLHRLAALIDELALGPGESR
jgi:DNA-binding MarR family transcriptional regulator